MGNKKLKKKGKEKNEKKKGHRRHQHIGVLIACTELARLQIFYHLIQIQLIIYWAQLKAQA